MSLTPPAFVPNSPATSRIGRFYITGELGRGTVGCVYLARDPVIGRELAIKTFKPGLSFTEKSHYEQQFINEARAAGCLSHPHIVTIYDASLESGTAYVAMEYLHGRELDKLMAAGHRFGPDQVASIAWKLADALAHAHGRDVVHRDVKPANIFMVEGDQPKLVDFGIARAPNRVGEKQTGDESYTLFRDNELLGTPNYMSPEQAQGKPVDARTDIYSLGAVMYEMLVGHRPFRSTSTEKLLQQIVFKTPPAPHELDSTVPEVLSRIVMKAMSKRPDKRYPNAGEMALDLKRFLLRQRRARRRVELPVQSLRNGDTEELSAVPNSLLRYGYLALGAAAAIAAFGLLHRG